MRSTPRRLDLGQGGLERDDVAVDVGDEGEPLCHRSASAGGMMKEMRRLATDLAVDRGDRATPAEAAAQLLHGDLQADAVTGLHDALETALVDTGEQADAVAEALLARHVDRHGLRQRLHLDDAGHDRHVREVAAEEPLARGHRLLAADVAARAVLLDDAVDEQERPAMRDELLQLGGREQHRRLLRLGLLLSCRSWSSSISWSGWIRPLVGRHRRSGTPPRPCGRAGWCRSHRRGTSRPRGWPDGMGCSSRCPRRAVRAGPHENARSQYHDRVPRRSSLPRSES